MSSADKLSFLKPYFERWDRDVQRAAELLASHRFLLEGILTLSCYLGAVAALRFPALPDGEAYIKVVLEYSGKRDFFEQIDLLFFYQWPRSKFRDHGQYKEFKNYTEIVEAIKKKYGSEENLNEKTRYVPHAEVVALVVAAKISAFDEQNFRSKLPLFSLAQILYRYLRCDAVHNADFPLLNESVDAEGKVTYKANHAITSDVLLETTKGVLGKLCEECLAKAKWPQEL